MSSPLFRPEVMDAQNNQWLGAIRLAQPVSGYLTSVVSLLLVAGVVAFCMLGSYTKKARVVGITAPVTGSVSVAVPASGVLVHVLAKEGQSVAAGQSLFELSTEKQGAGGELTALVAQQLANRRQTLDSEKHLRKAQTEERKQALTQQIAGQNAQLAQLQNEIALAERRKELAQKVTRVINRSGAKTT